MTQPILVVGAGPAGVRVVHELMRRCPAQQIVLYGDEAAEPYDRVQLSSFLMGDVGEQDLYRDMRLPASPQLEFRRGIRVTAVDRDARRIRDARGIEQSYTALVLATGARPHIPDIPGIALPGVLPFRNLRHTEQLFARRIRSRRAIVLGGGLLGLETARAMRRFHTDVVVIEHNAQLMHRQLDAVAAALLRQRMTDLGVKVVLGDGVRRVRGDSQVKGVELQSGEQLDCDTVVLATGIRPNIDLALQSGIAVQRGIRIDDALRTSDPHVFAIGECAEHRGVVQGLVGPGLEQAEVLSARLAGEDVIYSGSILATSLKVAGLPVFSVGKLAENDVPPDSRRHRWRAASGEVSSLVTHRGRLLGACGVGTLQEYPFLRQAVADGRRVSWLRLLRYRHSGRLWPQRADEDPARWPAATLVCNCARVSRGALSAAISEGCCSLEALGARTRAATVCGSCRPLVLRLLAGDIPVPAVRGATVLMVVAVLALLIVIAAMLFDLPQSRSVQSGMPAFWRDSRFKQVSGFVLVASVLVSLGITWSKRVRRGRGDTPTWRVVHVLLAALAGLVLLLHTGGRAGANLNLILSMSFFTALVLGAISALTVAREHRGTRAVQLRRRMTWVHLLLTWPLPALLVAHVVKTYFF